MKRNYLFFWFAVLLFLFSPARSYAEVYSGTCGVNVNWTLDTETGLLEITGSGEMEDYGYTITIGSFCGAPWYNCRTNIKECVIENSVTSIGNYAFGDCTGLTSIIIPNSVTSIGDGAFYRCTGLTSITIPESVTSIGVRAFYRCTGLTSITIPESVTSIGDEAFNGTPWLNNQSDGLIYIGKVCYDYKGEMPENTTIIIKEGTTRIESYAFSGCTGLTSITLPNSVTRIESYAFSGCTGLTSITLPNSVTRIGGPAFSGCTGLTSINVDKNNPNYCSQNGVLFTKDMKSINCVPAGKTGDYSLPNSVTSIGEYAFYDCTGLTNITIPESVTSIGDYTFYNCTGLTSITLPNSVTSIGDGAFVICTGLTSIALPNSVTSIGSYAFFECTGLTSITLPNSVTSIGDGAFYKCTGLTSINIPEGVTSIGKYAFSGCDNLKTVINLSNLNITEGSVDNGYVAYYANKVIKADTQIDDFFFEDRTDGNYLIYYIGNETELTLPENYQGGSYNVGESVFSNYSKLTNIIIPESVTSIGNSAFCGCTGLTSITIPESVTSIGNSAFSGCSGLTSITIPESVTSIGNSAFSVCSGLTSITIPESVTSIGKYAFKGCSGLTSITIPESVTSIGKYAFKGCSGLTSITCRAQEPPVCGNSALDGIDTWDCTLFVPEGAEALYKAADQWKDFFFIEEITGIDTPRADDGKDTTYDIYDMSGRTVRKAATTTDGLKPGLYIINGRKVLVE